MRSSKPTATTTTATAGGRTHLHSRRTARDPNGNTILITGPTKAAHSELNSLRHLITIRATSRLMRSTVRSHNQPDNIAACHRSEYPPRVSLQPAQLGHSLELMLTCGFKLLVSTNAHVCVVVVFVVLYLYTSLAS